MSLREQKQPYPAKKINFGDVIRRISGVTHKERYKPAVSIQRIVALSTRHGGVAGLKETKHQAKCISSSLKNPDERCNWWPFSQRETASNAPYMILQNSHYLPELCR